MDTPDRIEPAPASAPPPGWESQYPPAAQPPPPPRPGLPRREGAGRRSLLLLGIATAIVLAAFAVLHFGGGKSGGGGGPFSPVADAAERTASVEGARVVGTGTMTANGTSLEMRFSGAYDGDRSSMEMEITSAGAETSGLDQIGSMTIVTDGMTVYMTAPMFAGQLPDGKTWMKLDLEEAGSAEEVGATDATAMLAELEGVGRVTRRGTERIRGQLTTRYRAEGRGGSWTSDVWIDDAGYVRRMTSTQPFEVIGGAGSEISMIMDFYDFGVEPEIEVPSDDDAFDATDLAVSGLESQL